MGRRQAPRHAPLPTVTGEAYVGLVEDEVYEHIPWEHLTRSEPDRRRWVYLGSAAVLALAVTVMISRSFGSPAAVALPPTTATPVTTPPSSIYTEADLGATIVVDPIPMVSAAAEWFVSDEFTLDGSEGGDQLSFVEWVASASVAVGPDNHFLVTVWMQRLAAPAGHEYRRLAPEAVIVDLVWQDGQALVSGPPRPLPRPVVSWAERSFDQILSPATEEAALETAGQWGARPRVLGGRPVGTGFEALVSVEDAAGLRWELVVVVP